ncbi:hypothetical protein GCM10010232_49610 [Streptomyces amakusaensis]
MFWCRAERGGGKTFVKSTRIERRAEKLRWCTGLRKKAALARVRKLSPADPLIPEPHPDQALLECQVLNGIRWPQISMLHPWGIRYLDPRPDSLVIGFEHQNAVPRRPKESVVRELARLLPTADGHGDVSGVPGGRFTLDEGTVVLHRLGHPGSVTFAGVSAEAWEAAVEKYSEEEAAEGMTLCHLESPLRWHRTERAYWGRSASSRAGGMLGQSAWLASGLLRRAGLLRTIGIGLNTTAWASPDPRSGMRWTVEHGHAPVQDGPLPHERYLRLLTDPECGLGLIEARRSCHCDLHSGGSYACRVTLASATGRPGTLQFRFTRHADEELELWQMTGQELTARQRLYRRLPSYLEPALGSGGAA